MTISPGERETHEVDALWPAHRLVVQLDGFAFHRTRRDVAVHGTRTIRRLRRALSEALP